MEPNEPVTKLQVEDVKNSFNSKSIENQEQNRIENIKEVVVNKSVVRRDTTIPLIKTQGDALRFFLKKANNPLIIVDKKKVTRDIVSEIKDEDIWAVFFMKDSSAVKIYGDEGANGMIEVVTKDYYTKVLSEKSKNQVFMFLNDKRINQEDFRKLNPGDIKKFSVLDLEDKDRSKVIYVVTEEDVPDIFRAFSKTKQVSIIIDGEEKNIEDFQKLNPEDIKKFSVLKADEAKEKYGEEKSLYGEVEITTQQ